MVNKAFEKIKTGLEEALAIERGEKKAVRITMVDVSHARLKMEQPKQILSALADNVNDAIDKFIELRDSGDNKALYRYPCRDLENALGCVHKAIDRLEKTK